MSGIMDVKNDRTNVRRKAATSFRLTRFASGTMSDGSAAGTSALDSTALAVTASVSSTGESCCVGALFRISAEELLSADFAPSVVSVSALSATGAGVDADGCGVAGACALAAGSTAAGARGALARRPATFGRMPWALFICCTTIRRARSNRSVLVLLRKKPIW